MFVGTWGVSKSAWAEKFVMSHDVTSAICLGDKDEPRGRYLTEAERERRLAATERVSAEMHYGMTSGRVRISHRQDLAAGRCDGETDTNC